MTYRARTDANHVLIAEAFRRCGATVHHTHRVGGGFPDMAVGINGMTLLVEIKTAKGKLNDKEQAFFDEWKGHACVVRTIEEAVEIVGRLRSESEIALDNPSKKAYNGIVQAE